MNKDVILSYLVSVNQETTDEPYPVMFFIHGGMYQLWGNILFPGHFLAQRKVVVVSINYRLGVLGNFIYIQIYLILIGNNGLSIS